jgi:ABC-type lipopolysaccharide export system ATPase subunit
VGLLDPNGAGKSTSMRMITGFIPHSAGKSALVIQLFAAGENFYTSARRDK